MDDNILGDVLNYLTDAAHKWREIGIQLKIPSSKLDIIRIDNGDKAERCLVGMLTEFFKTKCCDDKTSWKKIIEALEASSVGEMNIARQIREERKLKVNKRTRGRRNEKEILLGMNIFQNSYHIAHSSEIQSHACMCMPLIRALHLITSFL